MTDEQELVSALESARIVDDTNRDDEDGGGSDQKMIAAGGSVSSLKPNQQLTAAERATKKQNKAQLKRLRNIQYWQRRVLAFSAGHHKCNKDTEREQRAIQHLSELLLTNGDAQEEQLETDKHDNNINGDDDTNNDDHCAPEAAAAAAAAAKWQSWIHAFYRKLMKHAVESSSATSAAATATTSAKDTTDLELLKHMRRGSVELCMFSDHAQLWGYTRTKFVHRASTLCKALSKVGVEQFQREDNLLRAVKSVCSIGAGPASDAVGVSAFLHANYDTILERIVLADFAVADWKAVTERVIEQLVPKHVGRVDQYSCDVTMSLDNAPVNEMLRDESGSFGLFLVSYLLTETHGAWYDFMTRLVDQAANGCLFYFAEPRPWQLQILISMFAATLEFTWIDSSFGNPSLQALGTRIGPAVLLGVKH